MSASIGFEVRAASYGCSAAVRRGASFIISERTGVIVMAENSDPHATHFSVIRSVRDRASDVVVLDCCETAISNYRAREGELFHHYDVSGLERAA
jgi:hypothetical protein